MPSTLLHPRGGGERNDDEKKEKKEEERREKKTKKKLLLEKGGVYLIQMNIPLHMCLSGRRRKKSREKAWRGHMGADKLIGISCFDFGLFFLCFLGETLEEKSS